MQAGNHLRPRIFQYSIHACRAEKLGSQQVTKSLQGPALTSCLALAVAGSSQLSAAYMSGCLTQGIVLRGTRLAFASASVGNGSGPACRSCTSNEITPKNSSSSLQHAPNDLTVVGHSTWPALHLQTHVSRSTCKWFRWLTNKPSAELWNGEGTVQEKCHKDETYQIFLDNWRIKPPKGNSSLGKTERGRVCFPIQVGNSIFFDGRNEFCEDYKRIVDLLDRQGRSVSK